LVHAGTNSGYLNRKGVKTLGVSTLSKTDNSYCQITNEEIETIISDFALAAMRAKEAGFDAVQFHGAHGYLMCQFLSPLYNRRTDKWGGNAEKRRRFHLEVIRRTRSMVGDDYPLMIKFGVQDDRKGGLSLDEGLETARQMVREGINAIEVSGGIGTDSAQVKREGDVERPYFHERAATVKTAVNVPVMAVGGIRNLKTAKSILDREGADLISMCRPFIREPNLVLRWSKGERNPAKCISCNKCFRATSTYNTLVCGEELRLRQEAICDVCK
jgi:2,4-dienoyl-CoA reductase-like NADH-dependent reductase (Old Yellow Enzyme family)